MIADLDEAWDDLNDAYETFGGIGGLNDAEAYQWIEETRAILLKKMAELTTLIARLSA